MIEKNKKDELQSRREFFRKATCTVLPAFAVITLSAIPKIMKAGKAKTGCEEGTCAGTCSGDCKNTCKTSCRNTCKHLCAIGCAGACVGTCSGSCKNTCINSDQ